MSDQSEALSAASTAAASWIDKGELLDMSYVRKNGLCQMQVNMMVQRRYPELCRGERIPMLEKRYKGKLVVIIERRKLCLWRWGKHWQRIREYTTKIDGDWKVFGKLSEIPMP